MVSRMTKVSIAIIISDYYKKFSEGLIDGAKDYCDKNNISMVLTGTRHFKH